MLSVFLINSIVAQKVTLEGYVFEDANRGFLNEVAITVLDENKAIKAETFTDKKGFFTAELAPEKEYIIRAKKLLMHDIEVELSTKGKKAGDKVYSKIKMEREPGYLFDVTLSEAIWGSKEEPGVKTERDAIVGARIEIFNDTKEIEELVLEDHKQPTFNFTFEQGNQYTIMIRKKNFLTKRIVAKINVAGCIMCFEGLNNVRPEVSDVLTQGHTMGTLIANIELERVELNKAIEIENIYYDYNESFIRPDAAVELDKVVALMKDNPVLLIELGSHTDARGRDQYNQTLSQARAKSAVNYIIEKGNIPSNRITARGYGETMITNRCRNGVDCSDKEHEENRRTEIKVIGYADSDPYDNKSLRQILMDEKIERMASGGFASEEVKVGEDGELPAHIKAEIEEQERRKKARAENKLDLSKNNTASMPLKSGPKETATEEVEEEVVETIEEVVEEVVEEKMEATEEIVEEVEVTKETFKPTNAATLLEKDYSGHKIEFFTSNAELPSSHEIFENHGNVFVEQRKDGSFAYLLGDFKKAKDAKRFLNTVLSNRYPNAKVIEYSDGVRSK